MNNRSARPELPETWAEAANEAEYVFYEVATPVPSYRWAGGYGYSHRGPVMLEILAVVEGEEVSVETFDAAEVPPLEIRRSILLEGLVRSVVGPDDANFELPQTLALDDEQRTISIDGEPCRFTGYAANGRAWFGSTVLSDGREIVVRDPAGVRPTGLAACENWAMSDRGPTN